MSSTGTNLEVTPLRLRNDVHIVRKLWHMGTGLIGLYVYYGSSQDPIKTGMILLAIAVAGLFLDFFRLNLSGFNNVAVKIMKPFMRENERNGMSGLPFYALGVAISLFLFPKKIAILSIMFLIFSDPISSFVGVNYGKDKILPNKSVQGCLAGFIVCYMLTLFYGIAYSAVDFNLLGYAIIGGLVGSVSELLSAFGIDDNLTIPVVSGFGLTLANFIFQIF